MALTALAELLVVGEDFTAADLAGRLCQEVKLAFTVRTDQRAARRDDLLTDRTAARKKNRQEPASPRTSWSIELPMSSSADRLLRVSEGCPQRDCVQPETLTSDPG